MSDTPAAPETPERILVVAAHPDDIDFGAAGSVARWVGEGAMVSYCLCTDGDAGGDDPSVSRSEMATMRRNEQTAAAETVGVTDLHWLGFPDGRLMADLALREALSAVIRRVRPQRVVMQGWERTYDSMYRNHPDHLAAGEATMNAVYPDARNQFAFPALFEAGLEPWSVSEVFLIGGPDPDVFVDITDTFEKKFAALLCHDSQIGDPEWARTVLTEWATRNAEAAGLGDGRLAEAYRRIPTA